MAVTLLLLLLPLVNRSNTAIPKSSQQLVALFYQEKFWAPWDQNMFPGHFSNQIMMNMFPLKQKKLFVIFCVIEFLWILMFWDQKLEVRKD